MSTNLETEERRLNSEEDSALAAMAADDGTNTVDDQPEEPANEPTASTDGASDEGVTTTPEPEKPSKPAGVLSKDGTSVLPFAVVQSSRAKAHEANQARLSAEAERDALRQQIEDLKAGRTPASEEDDPLDAAIAEAAQDVPVVAELHKALKATRAELKAMRTSRSEPESEQEPQGNPIQDAIDSIPHLAEWQAADPEKFQRAQAIDQALTGSPKWRDKSLAERFKHVAKQVADEFDIQIEDTAPQSETKTPSKADPREVVAGARRTAPNTLSDFKGGATDTTGGRIENLPSRQLRARIDTMTDEEMDSHLSKLG